MDSWKERYQERALTNELLLGVAKANLRRARKEGSFGWPWVRMLVWIRFKMLLPWGLLAAASCWLTWLLLSAILLSGCATLRQDIGSASLQRDALVVEKQLEAKSAAWSEQVKRAIAQCRALALPTVEARSECIEPTERQVVDVVAPAVERAVVELRAFWLGSSLGQPVAETKPHVEAAREAVDSIPPTGGGL